MGAPQILSELNKHPADEFIFRDDESHTYSIRLPEDSSDANLPELVSVTRLTEKYFKPFDADIFIDDRSVHPDQFFDNEDL